MNTSSYRNLVNLFELIRLLQKPPYKSVKQLARALSENERKTYRFLHILQEVGYPVKRDKQFRWQMDVSLSLLENESLYKRLMPVAHQLPSLKLRENIHLLQQAIKERKQVQITDYYSPKDGILASRIIEPLMMHETKLRIMAYCHSEQKQRQYRTDRMDSVKMLDLPQTFEEEIQGIDVFGLSGKNPLKVHLTLSRRAYRLLIEEFPFAKKYTFGSPEDGYEFKGEVYSWLGIGRFFLGLPSEMTVISPEEFKEYLRGRVGDFDL